MATVTCFEELKVWQEARGLVKRVYAASKQQALCRDVSLRNQVRSAATSTMSNIAEGFERGTRKEFIHFLNIAKGSNGEVRSQLYVALDQEYSSSQAFEELKRISMTLSRRIAKFIKYLESCRGNRRIRENP